MWRAVVAPPVVLVPSILSICLYSANRNGQHNHNDEFSNTVSLPFPSLFHSHTQFGKLQFQTFLFFLYLWFFSTLIYNQAKAFTVPRRKAISLIFSTYILSDIGTSLAEQQQQQQPPPRRFREYVDTFDGYSFNYPSNWIQVRGAGADIFFRDPYVLDENISVEVSSPSSSKFKTVEDLGPPQEAGKKVLNQYLTEFMSTRIGVKRESSILNTSSRVADDGKLYYQVEVGSCLLEKLCLDL